MSEYCYKLENIPDLTLNKYASLEGKGVDGILDKHIAFLRQWNRKGIVSRTSFHLIYFFDGKHTENESSEEHNGSKLEVLFLIRGEEKDIENIPQMIKASALSPYFKLVGAGLVDDRTGKDIFSYDAFAVERKINGSFKYCSFLTKKEIFIKSSSQDHDVSYYTLAPWESNESGRLFNMMKLMEHLDKRVAYRVDLYPVERGISLRQNLQTPMRALRERQYQGMSSRGGRDYEAENVIRNYEKLIENIESSPHFMANICVMGDRLQDINVLLDAAGAEALKKGNYNISNFSGEFTPKSFLDDGDEYRDEPLLSIDEKTILRKQESGLIICNEEAKKNRLRYLPNLFTVDEIAPFFRFPALYEGETIQKRKETAPAKIEEKDSLYLGKDDNGYEVLFPLKNLQKHAFIAGVPGSGKTNIMHHLTSTLWKQHNIPFLVLEPAKQEYRALANEPGMEELYIFAPNAEMLFPLHINPFEFPKGIMVAEHIRRLCSVFEGAFPLDNPMPFLLDTAIEAVYRESGWTPQTVYNDDTKLKFPTMSMLYKKLEEELKTTTYSDEIRGNLESALKVRIGSLLRREMGDVFDVAESTIPPEKWLEIPAVIELESMGTGPANFLTLMLCALIRETLKVNPHYEKDHARHMIFIEEAHNLIGPDAEEATGGEANPKQAATAFIVKMLAEVRALKEGIVIADQLPTVMAPEILKNTGLKIGLRITSGDDRGLLGSTMAANGMQLEEMATFTIGRALISYEGLMRPFTMQTQEWLGEGSLGYVPDKEKRKRMTESKFDEELSNLLKDTKPYQEICAKSFKITGMKYTAKLRRLTRKAESSVEKIKINNVIRREIKSLQEQIDLSKRQQEELYMAAANSDVSEIKAVEKLLEMDIEDKKSIIFQKEKKLYTNLLSDMMQTWNEMGVLLIEISDKASYWLKLGFDMDLVREIRGKKSNNEILTENEELIYAMWNMKMEIYERMKWIIYIIKINGLGDVTEIQGKMDKIQEKYVYM